MKCSVCNGSKKCVKCFGTGKTVEQNSLIDRHEWACDQCNSTGICNHCMGVGEEKKADPIEGVDQKSLNEVFLSSSALAFITAIFIARHISTESIHKGRMKESIEKIRKTLLVDWEAEENEPPEGKLFREQAVEAYDFLVGLIKERMEKEEEERLRMDAEAEEMAEQLSTAKGVSSKNKRPSRAPYIAVAASRLVDFFVDLVSGE